VLVAASVAAPVGLAQSELDNGSWCGTPAYHDVGLNGTSHVPQGGRIRIFTCRPKGSGDSSHAGAGSTKRCFGVQSENSKERLRSNPIKNRNQSTQQSTFINLEITASAVPDKGTR